MSMKYDELKCSHELKMLFENEIVRKNIFLKDVNLFTQNKKRFGRVLVVKTCVIGYVRYPCKNELLPFSVNEKVFPDCVLVFESCG